MMKPTLVRTAGGAAFVAAHHADQRPRIGWHSPIPYLFGGLAAMLALIAFALMVLACSYWKLSGYLDNETERSDDLENGDAKLPDACKMSPLPLERRIVVIMAGDQKPTFIATPISAPTSPSESTFKGQGDGEYIAYEKEDRTANHEHRPQT